MTLNLMFHDNCFDGASSAAVFLRFYQDKISPTASVALIGLAHQPGQQFHDGLFAAEENAIVDFKYASSDRLTWWFDHHHSAFLTPEDERHFRQDRSGKRFYDPSFKSCTKLIATVTRQQFGFECPILSELVHWADIIDGAMYPDAKTAVEVGEPAQKLAAVIEANQEPEFLHGIIRQLSWQTLSEVATQQEVLSRYAPLASRHADNIRAIREASHCSKGVLFFDLTGTGLEGYNKFIPYYLHPEANYTVSLMRTPKRMKVSVGWNPWSRADRKHNLAAICERYGGGGHPVVAAISFQPKAGEEARKAAEEIMEELRKG
ncbi:MAG: phosphoesterase [Acidobacteria bacterium]|nr:phosphoesterase [Acidobacteriota bacterium]MCI0621138.1 phosphoesterase [Acidobacteriota bacterium]MCI0725001.1 phosphoesterase [Acidobacteriota bacterium]